MNDYLLRGTLFVIITIGAYSNLNFITTNEIKYFELCSNVHTLLFYFDHVMKCKKISSIFKEKIKLKDLKNILSWYGVLF